jgi:transposase
MEKSIVGIDISKRNFTVSLLENNKHKVHCFDNNLQGYKALLEWINEMESNPNLFCMEATGSYGDALADFLYSHNYNISVVNPFQVKSFANTLLKRHKTDKVDCKVIAHYAERFDPALYIPRDPNIKELRQLYRCSQGLNKHLIGFRNRLENIDNLCEEVKTCWNELIEQAEEKLHNIEKRMVELVQSSSSLKEDFINLQTIKGIAQKTTLALLAELPDINNFDSARQLAAFAGLTPRHFTSGSSVHRRAKISKVGSASLRKALYLPAITAKNHNPLLKEFAQKLKQNGKSTKVIIVAIMRKMIHIIYGIIKSKTPFNQKSSINYA